MSKTSPVSCVQPVSRCPGSWEGAWPGQMTWTDQRDIPYPRTLCSLKKGNCPGGIHYCSGMDWAVLTGWWAILFHITYLKLNFIPLYLFIIPHFSLLLLLLLLLYTYLILFIKLFLSQPMVFLPLSNSLPHPTTGNRNTLSCHLGLTAVLRNALKEADRNLILFRIQACLLK